MRNDIDYSGHRILLEMPTKCRKSIGFGPHECHSKKFLKEDSFVKIRGTLCAHYKCKKCGADYFVAANQQPFGV